MLNVPQMQNNRSIELAENPMKTIIAGGRNVTEADILESALDELPWQISEVVSGGAKGVDQMGEEWAERNRIPVKLFKADWKTYGRAAGPKRNEQMADYGEALLAIWDGKSKGTANMIKNAEKQGLTVHVFRFEG